MEPVKVLVLEDVPTVAEAPVRADARVPVEVAVTMAAQVVVVDVLELAKMVVSIILHKTLLKIVNE